MMKINSEHILKILSTIFVCFLSVMALLMSTNIIDNIENFYMLYTVSLIAL